ncbi:MAG: acyl carrier protein [Lachnospiraceae bacterium]|nr:acyl carrier protein [Lachnospiraceae bacterium]
MNTKEILDSLIREFAGKNADTVSLEGKNLVDDLGYDSLNLMQLIAEIEEKFDISMDDDVLIDSFDNYNSLLECVLKLTETT